MNILTAEEFVKGAKERFFAQYELHSDDFRLPGGSLGEVRQMVRDAEYTPAGISAALNDSWAKPTCSNCGERKTFVVEFEENTKLCKECINAAYHGLKMVEGVLK